MVALAIGSISAADASAASKAVDLRAVKPSAAKIAALRKLVPKNARLDVQVVLRAKWDSPSNLGPKAEKDQRYAVARLGTRAVKDIPKGHGKLLRAFEGLPAFSVSVDRAGLDALLASDEVAVVQPVRVDPVGDFSSGVAQASAVVNRLGADGAGWTVAILDTGVDHTHPVFAGRITDGACFRSDLRCANGKAQMYGLGAGRPCTFHASCDHGTHVAGIAAGRDPDVGDGVAPGAKILPIATGIKRADGTPGFNSNDVIDALNFIAGRAEHGEKIAAVNMSYGGGENKAECTDAATQVAIKRVRDAGVALVAITQNQGYLDAMAHPACLPGMIRVGATDTDDKVTGFSNAAYFMHLWAPGQDVMAAVPGGKDGAKSGTSMAAPQVTGTIAVLKQLAPSLTVDQELDILQASGKSIKDTRTGGTATARRLDVYEAVRLLYARKLVTGRMNSSAVISHDSDFDLDHRKDELVWRPSNGTWYGFLSKTNTDMAPVTFGGLGDIPVPGDYDGDGVTDVGVWRAGTWFWKRSSDGAYGPPTPLGEAGDIVVPADYDGDKTTDLAVYRGGTWITRLSSNGQTGAPRAFGGPTDVPVPGDYDGDGRDDMAVFRPANGTWYWIRSSDGAYGAPMPFGGKTDIPVPGRWDADASTDPGVKRYGGGWYSRGSLTGIDATPDYFGGAVPMVADYDGDGQTDRHIVYVSNGILYWGHDSRPEPNVEQMDSRPFGAATDVPLR
jgi:hypothetical protein